MALQPGDRLGPYEVTGTLGAGGMGEVYRARDTRLNRDVALKVLPESFASDPDRLMRFTREAQTLAALNHPNIAGIYGIEENDGVRAIVMELVEGRDLSELIAAGSEDPALRRSDGAPGLPPSQTLRRTAVASAEAGQARGIPIEDALPIARSIADALETAHDAGIIHRDLKPANVKVRPDGTVKVLDFGLAKGTEGTAASGATDLANSPTRTSPALTAMGVILGTAAYMAPEQAKGRQVDRRADIWAFGVVLYEMLTGRAAFEGEDVSDLLVAVLSKDVDLDALPAATPAHVRRLIARCLDRNVKTRLQHIAEARIVLDAIIAGVSDEADAGAAATATSAPSSSRVLPWALAAAGAIVAGALAFPALRHLREAPAATSVASLSMDIAPAERLGPTGSHDRPSRTAFAIAPDGATIVFAGETTTAGGASSTILYRRPIAEATAVVIPGTEGAEYPFFSPDGQWVGFAAGGKLKKVALGGGPPLELCDIGGLFGGASWGTAGVIAFADLQLQTVPDSGGTPEPVPDIRALAPALLPDGQTVLFTDLAPLISGDWDSSHVDALDLKTRERKTLLANAADARYSPTGHLVFMRDATLLAVPFDATRVEVTGAAVPLLAGVMQSINATNSSAETGMGQFALSASGALIYAAGDINPTGRSTMVRVDRKGTETRLAEVKGDLVGLRLSSSGVRVVAFRTGDGSRARDLWMYEVPSGTPTRLTSTGGAEWPVFLPDGRSLTFTDLQTGIYALPLGSSDAPERLIDGRLQTAASWSPDGRWLAYLQFFTGAGRQIFVRAAQDGRLVGEPRQWSPSAFQQTHAEFSPDSHWMAYVSNDSGDDEVYVQPFPGPGEKRRVSPSGGSSPAWSRNGRELYFLSGDGDVKSMFAVDVSTAGGFQASAPRLLFTGRYSSTTPLRSYDVTPDGQFIMSLRHAPPDEPVTRLNVVLGWAETLKNQVPGGK